MRAVIPALAPGIDTTGISPSIAALTRSCPGSEIEGIPASDTWAKDLPSFNKSINPEILS